METIAINIVDNHGRSSNPKADLSVNKKGRIILRETLLRRFDLKLNDYILFGNVAGNWFISKKPEGFFGYKLRAEGKSRYLVVSSKSLLDIQMGDYSIGDVYTDENKISWYPLVKI